MRKPEFCICDNKGADQLRGDHSAEQRLRFRYIDVVRTIPLLSKSEISSSVAVQPGLCQTGFLVTCHLIVNMTISALNLNYVNYELL